MEGYKKSIQKEQEQNEKLTLILAKTERDIESVRKQLTQCHARFDALKAEYTTYTRMLHETEQALNRATAVSLFVCLFVCLLCSFVCVCAYKYVCMYACMSLCVRVCVSLFTTQYGVI